ncbi:MAG TPA: ferritin-like domain-containing protein [Polyangiaceae bacterium]|nr:ferritin-like domain-containing protein [Polyangiaceae bacterium]
MSEPSTEAALGAGPPAARPPAAPPPPASETSLALAHYVKQAKALPPAPAVAQAQAPLPAAEGPRRGEGAPPPKEATTSAGEEFMPAPAAAPEAAPSAPSPERAAYAAQAVAWRSRAFRSLGLWVLTTAVGFALAAATNSAGPLLLAALGGVFFALAACWYGAASFWRGLAIRHEVPNGQLASALVGSVAGLAAALAGFFLALMSTMAFTRGRQVRRFGRALLPPVGGGDAWSRAVPGVPDGPLGLGGEGEGARRALAAQWRENGRTEHASVAAFARHTLDLIALGAPPSLVAAAQRDALDEIRHAELCFGLARAIDGRDESPGAFPEARSFARPRPRLVALGELAVDSLVDGALHEGASARIVAKLARRCEEPAVAAILKAIAADEGRHAAHAWDVVRWCVAEGGEPVLRALEAAARALPRSVRSELPEAARGGAWERWGIAGEALEAEELGRARADAVRRVGTLRAGDARRAA